MIAKHSNSVSVWKRAEVIEPSVETVLTFGRIAGELRPVICPECRRHRTAIVFTRDRVSGVAHILCRGCAR